MSDKSDVVDRMRDATNWPLRLAVFAVYPLFAAFFFIAIALVLALGWPCMLIIHLFPEKAK